jgi:aminopeptidase N
MNTSSSNFFLVHFRYILPLFIAMIFFHVGSVKSNASAGNLVNRVSVSFELEKNTLRGVSRIALDSDRGISLQTGSLVIDEILVNKERVDIQLDEDNLLVIPAASSGQEVVISYSKVFPESPGGQRSLLSAKGIVMLDVWYPLTMEESVMDLTALIPNDFSAISEADDITTERTPDGKKVHFSFSRPLSFVHFVAGPYVVEQEDFGDGEILTSYFFEEDKDLAAGYRHKTKQYLERYEKLIAPYPYPRYSIVENRLPTGFAMPTFTLLGQSVVRLPFIVNTSLGHEVLHSWFGNAVNVDYEEGNWCEGLTTYLADHAFKEDRGEGDVFRKDQMVKYMSHVPADNEMSVMAFKSAGDHGPESQANRAVGYNKTSMIFHMLRQKIGQEKFIEALRNFYEKNKYQYAGWKQLEESFTKASGVELESFFEQWLNQTDIPDIFASRIDIKEEESATVLTFDLLQKNQEPYELSVPVRVETEGGVIEKIIETTGASTSVNLDLAHYPQKLIIDPNYDVMRQLSSEEVPPVWSRFLGAEEKIAVIADDAADIFTPMEDMLAGIGVTIVAEEEFNDEQLNGEAILFLGTTSKACRSIFATPHMAETGFSLDVRDNPVKANGVAVLMAAASSEQVAAVTAKLRHYGKYGYLHFEDGKIQTKRIPETAQGQEYQLDQPPVGVVVGKRSSFDAIMDDLVSARVVYVGETHVNQADHQLQLRVVRAMHKRYPDLAIGMEMFNKNAQESLDKYINGELEEREFLKESSYFKNWGYDYRLYRDIMTFARRNSLPVIALNLDKEIVSNTFRKGGISGLSDEEKEGLPEERDLGLAGYLERLGKAFQSHSGPHFSADKMGHFVQAQALWDETMAESVADYLKDNPQKKVIVIAGSGHVYKDTGMPPRVARRIDVEQAVVVNVKENELEEEAADYAFFSPPIERKLSPLLGVMLKEGDEGLTIAGFSHAHSGAKNAELKEKDIILSVDGEEIKTIDDIKLSLLYKEYGEIVTIQIKRPVFLFPDAVMGFEVKL